MPELMERVKRALGMAAPEPAVTPDERERRLVAARMSAQERRLRILDERVDAQRGKG